MRLTDLQIQKLPVPDKGQKTYWEKGFGVRVSQGGSKSFVVMYGEDRRLKTIGKYPSISLKTARQRALELKVTDTPKKQLDRLKEARSAFLEDCETRLRPKTIEQYKNYLQQCDQIYLSGVTKDNIKDQSPHAIASWKVFFNWCIRYELTNKNPFLYMPVRYNQRTRFLSDGELRQVWNYDFPPYSDYLKLQILTGQRIGQWKAYEISDGVITFPADVMKGKKSHQIPLTDTVAALLPIPSYAGWSKAKARIDKHVVIDPWTVHDIRTSFSTHHAALGTPIHVVEELLSHKTGSMSRIARIYNQYNYMKEMRVALSNWERWLDENVIN